jgi:serine protease Do
LGSFTSWWIWDQQDHETTTTPPVAPTQQPSTPYTEDLTKIIPEVQPSVVFILCWLGGDRYYSGSGTIIDKRGYILTNKHVIEDAYEIYVFLCEGDNVIVSEATAYKASIVDKHHTADLAIIRITPGQKILPEITLGDSDSIKASEKVVAIGYPLAGFFYKEASMSIGPPTITEGIVSSSRLRECEFAPGVPHVQTSAALNPGNSGGALINTKGQLIGIPTMVREEAQNMGFAIAVNFAKPFIKQTIGK